MNASGHPGHCAGLSLLPAPDTVAKIQLQRDVKPRVTRLTLHKQVQTREKSILIQKYAMNGRIGSGYKSMLQKIHGELQLV